jgi:plasmid stabilization system protein ParE
VSRYAFGRFVESDLREIRDRIARDSVEGARRPMVRFVAAFRLLATRPDLGHIREDLLPSAYRFWTVGAYLIIYRAEVQPIEIVAVVHGARDVPALMNQRTLPARSSQSPYLDRD